MDLRRYGTDALRVIEVPQSQMEPTDGRIQIILEMDLIASRRHEVKTRVDCRMLGCRQIYGIEWNAILMSRSSLVQHDERIPRKSIVVDLL